jgi:hypothetical protein
MDQEVDIINTNTRNEKIKNFFVNNKKSLVSILVIIILILCGYFGYEEFQKRQKANLSNDYNLAKIKYDNGQKDIVEDFKKIINAKDNTYSPLAFYFLLDNDLITSKEEINSYFDIIINDSGLDKEAKNLNVFKKGLFNSDFADENQLLDILNPLIKSESIWKPHALYLMAEFYLANNQKQKSKEFFEQLSSLEGASQKIRTEAQKRLRSDFSE